MQCCTCKLTCELRWAGRLPLQSDEGDVHVGRRKRSPMPVRNVDDELSDGMGTIPLERSMVLSSGDSDSDWSDSE